MLRGNRWHGPVPMVDRFWSRVEKSDGCWLWIGKTSRTTPYGRISLDGSRRTIGAHVASWQLHYGPVPPGMCVCHHCDTPRCVRPDHLFLGTNIQNWNDMRAKGRGATPPRNGFSPWQRDPSSVRGERNIKAKLTECDVRAIRAAQIAGESMYSLALRYHVARSNIRQIVRRRTWAHI